MVSQGSGGSSGPSFLSATERSVGPSRLLRVLRSTLPEVLSREAGLPSLAPGMYFRVKLIGFFEGIDSERGYRVAGGVVFATVLQIGLDERTPDHVIIGLSFGRDQRYCR